MRDTLMIRINDDNNTLFVKYDDGRFTKWYTDNNGVGNWVDYDNAYEFATDAILLITDNSDLFYTLGGGKAKVIKSKEEVLNLSLNLYEE